MQSDNLSAPPSGAPVTDFANKDSLAGDQSDGPPASEFDTADEHSLAEVNPQLVSAVSPDVCSEVGITNGDSVVGDSPLSSTFSPDVDWVVERLSDSSSCDDSDDEGLPSSRKHNLSSDSGDCAPVILSKVGRVSCGNTSLEPPAAGVSALDPTLPLWRPVRLNRDLTTCLPSCSFPLPFYGSFSLS